MATVRELMEFARVKVEANAAEASAVGAVYKFLLSGDGGGTFLIDMTQTPSVREGDGDAQCVIKMAARDFIKMVEGGSDPKVMLFTGKLKIEGDMALAIKLNKFTSLFRG